MDRRRGRWGVEGGLPEPIDIEDSRFLPHSYGHDVVALLVAALAAGTFFWREE